MLLPVVGDLERLGVVARAVAGGARRIRARQEEQLDRHETLALARLAATLEATFEGESDPAVPRSRASGVPAYSLRNASKRPV